MSVRERCSCGAEFETDEKDAVKLVREWRRKHACIEIDPPGEGAGPAHIENAIGFRIDGLDVPVRREHEDW